MGFSINLRKLKLKDIPLMLEWMNDPDIYSTMQYNPDNISVESAETFIIHSQEDEQNLHLAIVLENDEYQGTVSLKNIDRKNRNAEFAIAVRKSAMGRGISKQAFKKILKIAFEELKLNKVYLYVRTDNIRAIRFYEKCKLREEGCFLQHICVREKYYDVRWYAILKDEYELM